MFKKIEALSSVTHQNLRLTRINSFDFAKTVLNAPLSASEFSTASRYYPIVFPDKGASPMVLFALNQKTNFYVNDDGTWKIPYVPAHIRRYPFILADSGKIEAKKNFVVCIDVEAPHFAAGQGDPLFTADGAPADITQNAIEFLKKFHQELIATQTLCSELEAHKVLAEKNITIKKNGKKSVISGFRCIDMEKLNKLKDAVLAKWVRNGLISLINIHLQSLANLKAIVGP
ncbi:MAG: SapC family protein [Desulfobacterales bacterium]|nr:SapC family protein [Desulfobacterales bacterium]